MVPISDQLYSRQKADVVSGHASQMVFISKPSVTCPTFPSTSYCAFSSLQFSLASSPDTFPRQVEYFPTVWTTIGLGDCSWSWRACDVVAIAETTPTSRRRGAIIPIL